MVTAQEMGKKGGEAKSEAKTAAARKNASKPRGKWVTAIAYELEGVQRHKAFGVVLVQGKPPHGAANHEWLHQKVRLLGVGLQKEESLQFAELAASSRMV